MCRWSKIKRMLGLGMVLAVWRFVGGGVLQC